MSYKSENWKDKLEEVRNHIQLKEGSVEKTADEILESQIEESIANDFIEDEVEVIDEKIVGTGEAISKIFKTKDKKEIDGIANLMNMTSTKVLQSMMKQNPKGFKRMAAKMGELPAMEQVEEGAVSAAQRAAIAISKKEKAGKPGYDKEGKSLKNKKEEIEEASKMAPPELIKDIEQKTDRNDHSGSIMALAAAMNEKKAGKMLELIMKMHKLNGSMTSDMIAMRKGIYDELMKKSKKMYKNHKEIYGAF